MVDTICRWEILFVSLQIFLIFVSGCRKITDYGHSIVIIISTLLISGILNLWKDKRLREAGNIVNSQPIEKFVVSRRHKSFKWSDWASIQIGDIIKVKNNQEMPCDALILNIVGSKHEDQTCYMRGSMWDDSKQIHRKRSYQGTMNRTNSHISDSKFVSQISGLVKWEYN